MQSNDVIRSLQVSIELSIDYCKQAYYSSFLVMNKCSGLNYNNISAPVKGLR